jgi:hypothetical protein
VGDVRSDAAAQLSHDAGLRGAHVPVHELAGQIHVREISLAARARYSLPRLG